MASIKTILHITPFYSPNVGGVETHLQDLTSLLTKRKYQQIVLTYSPLSNKVNYQSIEKHPQIIIRRFYLPGNNLFHQLEKYPFINFLYITPYLLIRSIIWLIVHHHPPIDTIHSHGLNGAIIGNILQKIFKIPYHVTSIYSTYDNVPFNSIFHKLIAYTLNQTNHVLTQTNQSIRQLINLKINKNKISKYHHWVNLKQFKPILKTKFPQVILFVGRMIPAKNTIMLAKIAIKFPHLIFKFVGTGPDLSKIKNIAKNSPNLKLIGDVPYTKLHKYYQSAHILCFPSKYQEGWGRVLAESIACGTPVITTNLGGTTEAVNNSVAIIIPPTSNNFKKAIKKLTSNSDEYSRLQKNCRPYAKLHYSTNNLKYITKYY